MTQERRGLVGDARDIASDGVRIVRTRLELLVIEVQREKALVVRQLIVASATLFLVSFGTLLAILALALALPEDGRQMVLGGLGGAFLLAGAACAAYLALRRGRAPLAATIETLRQDESDAAAMSELAILEQRVQLVELSASLQRATLARRLVAVEQRPGRTLFGLFFDVASRPVARRTALAAAAIAWRAWRRRKSAGK